MASTTHRANSPLSRWQGHGHKNRFFVFLRTEKSLISEKKTILTDTKQKMKFKKWHF